LTFRRFDVIIIKTYFRKVRWEEMRRPSIASEKTLLRKHYVVIESMCNRKKDLKHCHDYVQLWYVFNGTLCHTVGDKEYMQGAGSCVIVLPFTEHAINTLDSEDTPVTLSLSFMDEFLTERGFDFFSYLKQHSHFDGCHIPEYFIFEDAEKEKADELARDMLFEFMPNAEPDFDNAARILAEFLKLMSNTPTEKKDLSLLVERTRAIRRTVSYIADHYKEKIEREDLCTIAAMSRTVFSDMFHEVTGMTTKEFLLGLRVRKAQFLLQYTDKTLNEIADETGLYDKSRLSHIFCEHFGMTPMQFREQTRPEALESDKQTRRRMKFYPKVLADEEASGT